MENCWKSHLRQTLSIVIICFQLLSLSLFSISCSDKKKAADTTTIYLSFLGDGPVQNGGIALSGSSSTDFFMSSIDTSDDAVEIQVVNGTWTLYAIGWTQDGTNGRMSGEVRCSTGQSYTFTGGDQDVFLTINKSNCNNSVYTSSDFYDPVNEYFAPLRVVTCNTIDSSLIDGEAVCAGTGQGVAGDKGTIRSFKVIMPTVSPTDKNAFETLINSWEANNTNSFPSFVGSSFESRCYNISTDSRISHLDTTLKMPVMSSTSMDSIFHPLILGYQSSNCPSSSSFNVYDVSSENREGEHIRIIAGSDKAVAFLIDNTSNTFDQTAPSEVTAFNATVGNQQIILSWTNPVDTDFDHVEIWYGTGGKSDTQFIGVIDPTGTVITGLTNAIEYTFKAITVDSGGNKSTGVTVAQTPVDPDVVAVAQAISDLTLADIIFGTGDTATTITQNFTAPTAGTSGTTITWNASHPAISFTAGNATVDRVAAGATNANITLTATISKGAATDTKNFTVVVLAITDADYVAQAKADLTLANFTFNGGDTSANVTQTFSVPTTGTSSTTISWSGDGAIINFSGGNSAVNRFAVGSGSTNVTVTATITKGAASDTKTFSLTVIGPSNGYYIAGDGSGGGGAGDYGTDYNRLALGGHAGGDNDTIVGTSFNDIIFGDGSGGGGGGSKHRSAPGGNAGSGSDNINGGAGNDIIFGDGFNGDDNNGTVNWENGGNGGFGGGGGGGGNYSPNGNGGNGGLLAGGGGSQSNTTFGNSLYGGFAGGPASKPTGGSASTDNRWGGNSAIPSIAGAGYFNEQSKGGTGNNSYGAGGGAGFGGLNSQYQTINISTSLKQYANGGWPQGGNGQNGSTDKVIFDDSAGGLHAFVSSQLTSILVSAPGTTNGVGSGADTIDGGQGDDHLFGLGGNDIFAFELNDGIPVATDTIWDFNKHADADKIRLTDNGVLLSSAQVSTIITGQTSNVADRIITFTDGASKSITIVVIGINRDLVAADFEASAPN